MTKKTRSGGRKSNGGLNEKQHVALSVLAQVDYSVPKDLGTAITLGFLAKKGLVGVVQAPPAEGGKLERRYMITDAGRTALASAGRVVQLGWASARPQIPGDQP
jgi:hypothetical protein